MGKPRPVSRVGYPLGCMRLRAGLVTWLSVKCSAVVGTASLGAEKRFESAAACCRGAYCWGWGSVDRACYAVAQLTAEKPALVRRGEVESMLAAGGDWATPYEVRAIEARSIPFCWTPPSR